MKASKGSIKCTLLGHFDLLLAFNTGDNFIGGESVKNSMAALA